MHWLSEREKDRQGGRQAERKAQQDGRDSGLCSQAEGMNKDSFLISSTLVCMFLYKIDSMTIIALESVCAHSRECAVICVLTASFRAMRALAWDPVSEHYRMAFCIGCNATLMLEEIKRERWRGAERQKEGKCSQQEKPSGLWKVKRNSCKGAFVQSIIWTVCAWCFLYIRLDVINSPWSKVQAVCKPSSRLKRPDREGRSIKL